MEPWPTKIDQSKDNWPRLLLFYKPNLPIAVVEAKDNNHSVGAGMLEYFSSSTQIGMTATPKETKNVSNIDYFGELTGARQP